MLLGIDTYSYHLAFGAHPEFRPSHPMDLFAFIERASELGVNGFQIDPMHLGSREGHYLTAIRDDARSRGLFVEHGIMSVRAEDITAGVEECSLLGAHVLRGFLGFDRYRRSTDVRREIDHAEDQLRRSLPVLRDAGVRLAIENHGDLTSTELVELVERVDDPAVGICLDTGNALALFEDPLAAAERMVPFAISTHFKDCAVIPTGSGFMVTGASLGKGILPMDQLFRLIEEEGVVDRLILEIPMEPGHNERQSLEQEDEAVRQSVAFLRERLLPVSA